MRDIVVLVVCGVLIAAGAFIVLTRRDAPQTVALEPVQAVPMRIPNASTDPTPAPPAPEVRRAEPLEPRPEPSPQPQPESAPRPSPSPAPEPSSTALSDTDPASDPDSPADPSPTTPPVAPSSLPVRNSAQGWGVQAGAFRTETNAVTLRDRLLKSGLAARVEPVDNGIYRVLVGAYATADAARTASAGVLQALR